MFCRASTGLDHLTVPYEMLTHVYKVVTIIHVNTVIDVSTLRLVH